MIKLSKKQILMLHTQFVLGGFGKKKQKEIYAKNGI